MVGLRLRHRVVFFLLLAGAANFHMVSNARIGPPGLVAVGAAVILAYLGMRETVRRVSGTVYKERPLATWAQIAVLALVVGGVLVVERQGLGDEVAGNSITKALVLAFFLSQLMTLVWLIPYERRNGVVRMGR
jgi:hypothetical protein